MKPMRLRAVRKTNSAARPRCLWMRCTASMRALLSGCGRLLLHHKSLNCVIPSLPRLCLVCLCCPRLLVSAFARALRSGYMIKARGILDADARAPVFVCVFVSAASALLSARVRTRGPGRSLRLALMSCIHLAS